MNGHARLGCRSESVEICRNTTVASPSNARRNLHGWSQVTLLELQRTRQKNNSRLPRPKLPANHPGCPLVEDNAVREPLPAGKDVAEEGRNAGLRRKVAAESPDRLSILEFVQRGPTRKYEGHHQTEHWTTFTWQLVHLQQQ